jgi:hypothetical protein
MLIGWFLILWGLTFFFSAIWGLIDLGGYSPGYLIIEVLWDLTELAIAGILAILGLKVKRRMLRFSNTNCIAILIKRRGALTFLGKTHPNFFGVVLSMCHSLVNTFKVELIPVT